MGNPPIPRAQPAPPPLSVDSCPFSRGNTVSTQPLRLGGPRVLHLVKAKRLPKPKPKAKHRPITGKAGFLERHLAWKRKKQFEREKRTTERRFHPSVEKILERKLLRDKKAKEAQQKEAVQAASSAAQVAPSAE